MQRPNEMLGVRMIFLRVTRMTNYQGVTGDDTPVGGGAYVAEHGFGYEIFNFQPYQGAVYGFAQPPGRKDKWSEARINLTRIGAAAEDQFVTRVLAVWVATDPNGGAHVVGWYKNATVFRHLQAPPAGSARQHNEVACGYFVTAKAEDAVLLTPHERVFPIPQRGIGSFGQSNIWYADDPERHSEFRLKVLRYIESRQLPALSPPHQVDPLLRQQVEQTAVQKTTDHFTKLGYRVDSVEKDNVGWDLTAVLGKRHLQLEVKGLSGSQIVVNLTPNEYIAMQQHRDTYMLCIVTDALGIPQLEIFAYSPDSGRWESAERRVLTIQEIVAARCSAC